MSVHDSRVRRVLKQHFSIKQDGMREMVWPATLGDGSGKVVVDGHPDYVWVRQGGTVTQVYNKRVSPINEKSVYIGYTPYEPNRLQVVDERSIPRLNEEEVVGGTTPTHGSDHTWGGIDYTPIQLRQFMPFRITPAGGLTIYIYPGILWIGTVYKLVGLWPNFSGISSTALDLSSYVPISFGKVCFIMISIDNAGTIVATPGAIVNQATASPADYPKIPAGTEFICGFVCLHTGQVTIVEALTTTDIIDVRFSSQMWLRIIDLFDVSISSLSNFDQLRYDVTTGKWINFTPVNIRYELLMQDGVAFPPVPLTTDDGTDWLYVEV